MQMWKSWVVAAKDMSIFRRKKYIIYSFVILPLALSIGLPTVIWLVTTRNQAPVAFVEVLLSAFSFFYIILASILPTVLASYSFVGEKVEKSLEPLLATPTTDGELLFGKSLAAFLPSMAAVYLGATIFMVLSDVFTAGKLGNPYFPNGDMTVILLLAVPLACVFSIEVNVIISSMVSDIRAAQQLGGLVAIPTGGVYVLAETNFVTLNTTNLILISGLFLLGDVVLLFLSRATFRREEILTKWK